jgi:hypothetical protein
MTTRQAECSCGQLRVTTQGEPVRISMCHCLACQRRTGSAFGAQARWPREQVALEGRSSRYVRSADSGNRVEFHFCPECGATVYYWLEASPELIAVPIGAFADPTFPSPRFSVYERSRHPWTGLPVEIDHQP